MANSKIKTEKLILRNIQDRILRHRTRHTTPRTQDSSSQTENTARHDQPIIAYPSSQPLTISRIYTHCVYEPESSSPSPATHMSTSITPSRLFMDQHYMGLLDVEDVYHIAFLLRQKLPDDVIPMILDYAECWVRVRDVYSFEPVLEITGLQSPHLSARMKVPESVRPGSVKSVHFMTNGGDEGWLPIAAKWASGEYDGLDYPAFTWFEAAITDGSQMRAPCGHRRYDGRHILQCPGGAICGRFRDDVDRILQPRAGEAPHTYVRDVVMINDASKDDLEYAEIMWPGDSIWREGEERIKVEERVRRAMRELRGGQGIELFACAKHPLTVHQIRHVAIEIEYAPVTRL